MTHSFNRHYDPLDVRPSSLLLVTGVINIHPLLNYAFEKMFNHSQNNYTDQPSKTFL